MKTAAFTSVKNDPYLGKWLEYYSKYFDDLYVVDTEPEVEKEYWGELEKKYKFTRNTDYPNPNYSITTERDSMKSMQKILLEKYKWVLYSHADEFVVPDPNVYKDLGGYVMDCDKDYVYCTGYSVIQTKKEPPLDLKKPIFKQRKYWWQDESWNKPLLARVPIEWDDGFHYVVGHVEHQKTHNDKNLILVHLKQADLDIFNQRIVKFDMTGQTVEKGLEWFYRVNNKKRKIPERFKGML